MLAVWSVPSTAKAPPTPTRGFGGAILDDTRGVGVGVAGLGKRSLGVDALAHLLP
jgi:hypothetical protein